MAIIVVLKLPRIINGPIELQGHRPRMLQCQFNASALQGVTVVVHVEKESYGIAQLFRLYYNSKQ